MVLAGFLSVTVSRAESLPRLLRFERQIIEIDTVKHDAGDVRVRFVCENISDKDVSIVDVRSQCGCTVPEFSRERIRPGCKSCVDVVLKPEHLFAEQNRHLTVVATNGDYNKFNTITVHGYVDRGVTEAEIRYPYELADGLRSEVSTVGMRLSGRGEVVERTFVIYNDTPNYRTLDYYAGSGRVRVDVPAWLSPYSSAEVKVRVFTWDIGPGNYTETLWLYVDDELSGLILLKGAVSGLAPVG